MSLPFTVVDAFTDKAFGGNPAAVIVLPSDHEYQASTLQSIALEFNLSETAFVTVDKQLKFDSAQNYVSFGLRWFTPTHEVKICGHATLASAFVLYANPELVPEHVNEIRFTTLAGILAARRVSDSSKIELEFPVGNILAPDEITRTETIEMVRAATGIQNLLVTYVGVCSASPYNGFLLVELDSSVDLPSLKVNPGVLGTKTHPVTVITTNAGGGPGNTGKGFDVRVFANLIGIPEDPVTGSASSFAAKYWATRADIGAGQVMKVKQVSHRGGDLDVVWEEHSDTARLRGNARVASRGEIYL